jgi:hypothetical protein
MAELEETIKQTAEQVWDRTIELILAPLNNIDMLWIAIPLLITTLFMILYFGRHKKEELGWNTAFGNTMVFIFVAVAIIREMYMQGGESFDGIFTPGLYGALALGLGVASGLLMFFTYFHLLPKRLAFFMFSAPPINVAVYAVMSLVYANVAVDHITVLASIVLLVAILVIGKLLQLIIGLVGLEAKIEQFEIPGIEKEEIIEDEEPEKPKKNFKKK